MEADWNGDEVREPNPWKWRSGLLEIVEQMKWLLNGSEELEPAEVAVAIRLKKDVEEELSRCPATAKPPDSIDPEFYEHQAARYYQLRASIAKRKLRPSRPRPPFLPSLRPSLHSFLLLSRGVMLNALRGSPGPTPRRSIFVFF